MALFSKFQHEKRVKLNIDITWALVFDAQTLKDVSLISVQISTEIFTSAPVLLQKRIQYLCRPVVGVRTGNMLLFNDICLFYRKI